MLDPMIYVGLKEDYRKMARIGVITNDFDTIVAAVCIAMRIDKSELLSQSRKKHHSWGRFICYYLLRNTTKMSLKDIGYLFGGRDHTTVIYGLQTFQDLNKVDKGFRRIVYDVKNLLG